MPLIDTHAHLTYFDNIEEILQRAKRVKISHIINISTNQKDLEKALSISSEDPKIFHVAATHPQDVEKNEYAIAFFNILKQKILEKKIIAIGEIGLDFYRMTSSKKSQTLWLLKYLELAKETKLPVVFHCRDGFEELFELTKDFKGSALLHCFTGSQRDALIAIKRGWMVSFSGILTYPKNEYLRDISKITPLENILIETDSPYLPPQSKRGLRNEPSFIEETAKILGEIKNLSFEKISETTSQNAKKFFNL